MAPSAMPRAWEAMPIRPPSSVAMASWKPLPFTPSRRSFGMMQSSMMSSQVEEPRMPILSSGLPTLKPGSVRSTMKALISFCLRPRLSVTKPVTAMMMNTSAKPAFVMKILEPFSFQWSPSSTAKVCWP